MDDSESNKAYILCAMASMAYMFQESNDAKILLYQSVEIKPPIVSGLLALAVLGMLNGDKNLTRLSLKDLKAHDNNPEYRNHIAKIMAYSHLIHNDIEGACRVFCKYIHRYPGKTKQIEINIYIYMCMYMGFIYLHFIKFRKNYIFCHYFQVRYKIFVILNFVFKSIESYTAYIA
jgi:hypothetical protein